MKRARGILPDQATLHARHRGDCFGVAADAEALEAIDLAAQRRAHPPLAPARPRAYLNARFRDGKLVELRALSEPEGSSIGGDVWLALGISAGGSSSHSATARCWRRWWRLSAGQQHDVIEARVLKARASGVLR
jgi:hypothetical protein